MKPLDPWRPPREPRAPKQLSPATVEPCPLESTARDISAPGAPIVISPLGIDHVRRLAAIGGSNTDIAGALRMSRATFREIRRRQPEVNEALAQGRSTLRLELVGHLLKAGREGDAHASAMLYKLRFGSSEQKVAHSAQGDHDDEEAEEEKSTPIDWAKVPLAERGFVLLAIARVQEVTAQDGRDHHGDPVQPLGEFQRKLLAAHVALHKVAQQGGGSYLNGILDVLSLSPPPSRQELEHLRALRLTPHERRLTAGAEQVPNTQNTAPDGAETVKTDEGEADDE